MESIMVMLAVKVSKRKESGFYASIENYFCESGCCREG